MTENLERALDQLTRQGQTRFDDECHTIICDMLWKAVRRDWHGVADCAMDLRELEANHAIQPTQAR